MKNVKELKSELIDKNYIVSIIDEKPRANGELDGLVGTIKDNYATKNGLTTGSSNILKNFNAGYDATIVEKLLNNGTELIAKTELDELGLGGTGEYGSQGLITHPLDKNRIIGGSSSGSIASMYHDIDFSIGSDTGDSIRRPASFNGFVGFKPSYGMISRHGLFSYAPSFDTVGYFTKNVENSIKISQVLYGIDKKDMTTREIKESVKLEEFIPRKIAILDIEGYTDKQRNDLNNLANMMLPDGVELSLVKPNKEALSFILPTYNVISYAETSSQNSNLNGLTFTETEEGADYNETMINTRSKNFKYMVQRRFTMGAYFLNTENINDVYFKAQKARRFVKNEFNKILENYDVVLYPSSRIAPIIGNDYDDDYASILTYANLVGNPSITIPFSKEDGLPYGLSIDSKLYNDAKVLSTALYIERLLKGGI